METKFESFPKMGRLSREVIVTEKIDGTNAQVHIIPSMGAELEPFQDLATSPDGMHMMLAGSRTRYLTRQTDNFGFAKWVQEHAEELWALGEGRHFGEWWGAGIQRRYDLDHKRFSLFNAQRWVEAADFGLGVELKERQEVAPNCCHVVPVLWTGKFDTLSIDAVIEGLRLEGSEAAPGFMKPEGIVVYHTAGNVGFKKTIEGDEFWKGKTK